MTVRLSDKRQKVALNQANTAHAVSRVPPVLLWLGAAFLLLAAATSLMLALEHFGGLRLPGCGPGSACAEAAASYWGKVPGTQWPVSFVGTAYFLGALAAWLGSKRGVPGGLCNLARLGALISLGYAILMFKEGHVCLYCLGSHLGNFGFWIVIESTRARTVRSIRPLATVCAVFIVASAVLGVVQQQVARATAERAERELAEDTAEIIAAAERTQAAATRESTSQQSAATGPAVAIESPAELGDQPFQGGFRGRYLYGPEKAAARLVIITDHQCRECRRIENQVRILLRRHDNVSLSIKYFPLSKACNPTVTSNPHPNACWAARAAEAAGILWGNDGFWAMHHWLFNREGVFETTAELESGIRELGYDPTGFVQTMMSDQTLALVRADIEESRLLGLYQTPMIFINGVELRGWYAQNAVTRAVAALLAGNPEPQTHEHDHPPPALEKLVGDWREQPVPQMPPDETSWPLGPQDARITIVVFGDYQEQNTKEADQVIRTWLAGRSDAGYVFRHYPFSNPCNPSITDNRHPQACWAARAAEAAGRLGGNDGYWRMHDWLMAHQQSLNDAALRQAAGELGFDADTLLAELSGPGGDAAISEDVSAGNKLMAGQRRGIPRIYIQGKRVLVWRHLGPEKGRDVLRAILEEAASGRL